MLKKPLTDEQALEETEKLDQCYMEADEFHDKIKQELGLVIETEKCEICDGMGNHTYPSVCTNCNGDGKFCKHCKLPYPSICECGVYENEDEMELLHKAALNRGQP